MTLGFSTRKVGLGRNVVGPKKYRLIVFDYLDRFRPGRGVPVCTPSLGKEGVHTGTPLQPFADENRLYLENDHMPQVQETLDLRLQPVAPRQGWIGSRPKTRALLNLGGHGPTPWLFCGLWLASLALYLRTLAPSILPADSGEFQFAAYILGLAHPTGYPLYLLLGRLFAVLPLGDVAYRLNFMSAFWAATAVSLVYLVALNIWSGLATPLGHRKRLRVGSGEPERSSRIASSSVRLESAPKHLAGIVAAVLFAVSDTFWSQAVIAEVYTLNATFVALSLLLLLLWARGKVSLWPLALTFGLSLAHHRTMILLVPAYLLFWLWTLAPWKYGWRHWYALPSRQSDRSSLSSGRAIGGRDVALRFCRFSRRRAQHLVARSRRVDATSCARQPFSDRVALQRLYGPGETPFNAGAGQRRGTALEIRRVLFLAALCLAPLLLYLYIPLRAPATNYLQVKVSDQETLSLYHNDLSGFWDMVSGRVFGDKLKVGAELSFTSRFRMFLDLLRQQVGLAGMLLGLAGTLWLLWRTWRVALLLLLIFGAIVGFGLVYTIGDVYVMFIPAYMMGSLFAGAAILMLAQWCGRLPWGWLWRFAAPLAGLGFAGYLAVGDLPRRDLSGEWKYRHHWDAVVAQPLEQGAILATDDRDDIVPFWYLQQAEGQRPDMLGIYPGMVEAEEFSDVVRVIDHFVPSGRPIYLIKPMPGLETRFALAPAGLLTKITGPALGDGPQSEFQANFANQLQLTGYDLTGFSGAGTPLTSPGATGKVTLRWQVVSPMPLDYSTFIHIADPSGKVVAQQDRRPGDTYYPSSRWRQGELIADEHEFSLPADAVPGTYEIRAGVYYLPTLERLSLVTGENIVTIGRFAVGTPPSPPTIPRKQ